MKRFLVPLLALLVGSAGAESYRNELDGGVLVPLEGQTRPLYSLGLESSYRLMAVPSYRSPWEWGVRLGYQLQLLRAHDSLSLADLGGEARWIVPWSSTLETRVELGAGGFGGALSSALQAGLRTSSAGWGLWGTTGLGFTLHLSPTWALSLAGGYRYDSVRDSSVEARLSLAYDTGARIVRLTVPKAEAAPVFPVFREYYARHPGLRLTIKNDERFPLTNLSIEPMQTDWVESGAVTQTANLAPGETRQVLVPVRWKAEVLKNDQSIPVVVTVRVSGLAAGERREALCSVPVQLFGHNNFVWSRAPSEGTGADPLQAVVDADDGKAAAFVNGSDPRLLNLCRLIRQRGEVEAGFDGLGANLRALLGVYTFLSERKVKYQRDPLLPSYSEERATDQVDYLRFPSETLAVEAGDCDDLSILTASLLEGLGVETALITVPGHIYVAIAPEFDPTAADSPVTDPARLIQSDGRWWLPVEVTQLDRSLSDAWASGLDEWAAAGADRQLYPVHEAWKKFGPALYPVDPPAKTWAVPGLAAAYRGQREEWAQRELKMPEAYYAKQMLLPGKAASARNKLAYLELKFGRTDRAVALLEEAVKASRSYAVCLNLGHALMASGRNLEAAEWYQAALDQKPTPEARNALAGALKPSGGLRLVDSAPETGPGRGADQGALLSWADLEVTP